MPSHAHREPDCTTVNNAATSITILPLLEKSMEGTSDAERQEHPRMGCPNVETLHLQRSLLEGL